MSPRFRVSLTALVVVALLFVATPGALAASPETADGDSEVKLVVVLVIDQLRRDRLDLALPGGLGELARGGRVFRESLVDHAVTETCPGHVVVSTGRHPGRAGIPGNRTVDRETGATVYCVLDESDAGSVLGNSKAPGRSPARIRVDALGDWMKQARPGTRVFSVSAKDRSAVTLGGQHPDAAYWFQREGSVGFSTSRYYRQALPDWVQAWNGEDPRSDGFLASVPAHWDHGAADGSQASARADEFSAEADEYARTSGHPIHDDDLEVYAERLYHSPFMDDVTLDFARALVKNEELGRGSGPDLLAIGLSATDLIGHLYGPESHESIDGLARLDAALGGFLAFLDEQVGPGRVLVALTADHGVLPLPEWLEQTGRGECVVKGGRADLRWLALGMYWQLQRQLGLFSFPAEWVGFAGSQVAVNRSVARARKVPVERVSRVVKRYLEARPEVARVWTTSEVLSEASPVARLYRNSYDPERSGDLMVQLAKGCLLTAGGHGTTHGTPYLYDRAVPLLFYGPGVTPGWVDGSAASVDVAPTLAAQLGVSAPDDLDGRALDLASPPVSSVVAR